MEELNDPGFHIRSAVSRYFVAYRKDRSKGIKNITELQGKRIDALEKYGEGVVVCQGALGYFGVYTWVDHDVKSDTRVNLMLRGLFPRFRDAAYYASILDGTDGHRVT